MKNHYEKYRASPELLKVVRELCMGRGDATEFVLLWTNICHFWDDLVDQDPIPDREGIYHGMWDSLITLPRDPFYARHFNEFNPIMASAIIDWRVANALEARPGGDLYDRRIAYIIRSSYVCVLQQTALIVGGPEWAERCGLTIRAVTHAEGFDAYLKTLGGSDGVL